MFSNYRFYLIRRPIKSDKRKEQKNLLERLQSTNEKISNLENALSQAQDDAKAQSSKVRDTYFNILFTQDAECVMKLSLLTSFIEFLSFETDTFQVKFT